MCQGLCRARRGQSSASLHLYLGFQIGGDFPSEHIAYPGLQPFLPVAARTHWSPFLSHPTLPKLGSPAPDLAPPWVPNNQVCPAAPSEAFHVRPFPWNVSFIVTAYQGERDTCPWFSREQAQGSQGFVHHHSL